MGSPMMHTYYSTTQSDSTSTSSRTLYATFYPKAHGFNEGLERGVVLQRLPERLETTGRKKGCDTHR